MINRLGGLLLVVAGLYVAWYGWYEIRIFADPDTTDPILDGAAGIQTALSGWLSGLGIGAVLIAFTVLLAAAITASVLTRRRRAETPRPPAIRADPPSAPGRPTQRITSTDDTVDQGTSARSAAGRAPRIRPPRARPIYEPP